MRRYLVYLMLGALLVAFGCSEERGSAPLAPTGLQNLGPAIDPEALAMAIVEQAGWPKEDADGAAIALSKEIHGLPGGESLPFDRQVVVGDIVHYSFRVPVGSGPYDEIGIHRVIREPHSGHPLRTKKTAFLFHGGGKDFVGNFMPGVLSAHVPDGFGMAVYLAQGNVDVWGIDASSTLVPWQGEEVPFMETWGMDRHLADLKTALEIARVARFLGGNGYRPMILSAYSSGVPLGYALLGEETQLPPADRKVSAFIPLEFGMKSDNPTVQQNSCNGIASAEGLMAMGIYGAANILPIIGIPARDNPEGPSSILEGFTNLQAVLCLQTWAINAPLTAHFAAGVFDEGGIATGLQYMTIPSNLDFLCYSPDYDQPVAYGRDIGLLGCPTAEAPWDDHMGEIEVPLLGIVAAGGYGVDFNDFDLVASTDKTWRVVSLHPPEEVLLDYGHIDPFNAENAQELVWQPMLHWIRTHSAP